MVVWVKYNNKLYEEFMRQGYRDRDGDGYCIRSFIRYLRVDVEKRKLFRYMTNTAIRENRTHRTLSEMVLHGALS